MAFKSSFWVLVVILGLAGCGTGGSGASAPPISLPAPVTGRMTVTGPDESGVALVIGDEGAVPAGSVVHAINGSKETVVLRVIEMGLGWVADAQAQAGLPEICSRTFHACSIADATGSFEISIPAVQDEEIVVEVLDPTTGFRISERFQNPVPKNASHFSRPVVDLGLLANSATDNHIIYALMPRTPEDPKGRITVVDVESGIWNHFSFAGPLPSRMAVQTETRLAAIVDPEGGFVGKVDLMTNNFNSPLTFAMEGPNDVVFNTVGNSIIVSGSGNPATNAILFQQIDFAVMADMDEVDDTKLQVLIPGANNVRTTSLDLIPFTTTSTFDLLAFIGTYNVGGVLRTAVGLANASSLQLLAVTFLPGGTVPEDVAFDRAHDRVLVSDSGNDKILIYDFTTDAPLPSPTTTLTLAGEIADPSGGLLVNPRDIIVIPEGFAFINAKNGTDEHPDTVLTVNLTTDSIVHIKPVGLGPSGSVFDPISSRLFVSTFKSHAVTIWNLPELLP